MNLALGHGSRYHGTLGEAQKRPVTRSFLKLNFPQPYELCKAYIALLWPQRGTLAAVQILGWRSPDEPRHAPCSAWHEM